MNEDAKKSQLEEQVLLKDSTVAQLLLRGQLEGASSPASGDNDCDEVIDLSRRGCSGVTENSQQSVAGYGGQQKSQKSKTKTWRCRHCPYTASETMAMYKHYQLHQAFQVAGLSFGRSPTNAGESAADGSDPAKATTIKTLLTKSAAYYPSPARPCSIPDSFQTCSETDFKEICISDDDSVMNDIYATGDILGLESGSMYDRSPCTNASRQKLRMSMRPFPSYHSPEMTNQNKHVDTDESETDEMRSNILRSYTVDSGGVVPLNQRTHPVKIEPEDYVGSRVVDVAVQCNIVKAPLSNLLSTCSDQSRASPMSADGCIVGSSDNDVTEGSRDQLTHRCNDCGITFDDDVLYTLHRGCHSHSDPFICNICGTPCENKYAFYTHILRGHIAN